MPVITGETESALPVPECGNARAMGQEGLGHRKQAVAGRARTIAGRCSFVTCAVGTVCPGQKSRCAPVVGTTGAQRLLLTDWASDAHVRSYYLVGELESTHTLAM